MRLEQTNHGDREQISYSIMSKISEKVLANEKVLCSLITIQCWQCWRLVESKPKENGICLDL